MVRKPVIRYSEAFKGQVVREIESGKFSTCHEASTRYGIRGASTVQNWVRRYGQNHLLGKVVRVETLEERDELKALRKRVKDLESLLADTSLDLDIERNFVIIACEKAGIKDVDAFKKKARGIVRRGR
jgi:transposase-like protein